MSLRERAIQAHISKQAQQNEAKRQKLARALEILGPLVAPSRFQGRDPIELKPAYYLCGSDEGGAVVALVDDLVFGVSWSGELLLCANNHSPATVKNLEDLGRILLTNTPDPLPAGAVPLVALDSDDEPYAVAVAEPTPEPEPTPAPAKPKPRPAKKAR